MSLTSKVSVLALLAATATPSQAATLFQSVASFDLPTLAADRTFNVTSYNEATGVQLYSRFSLAKAATIDSVIYAQSGLGTAGTYQTEEHVEIYRADSAGRPTGALVASTGNLTADYTSSVSFLRTHTYDLSAAPLALAAGDYVISLVRDDPAVTDMWGLPRFASATYTGYLGGLQGDAGTGSFLSDQGNGDIAFAVNGTLAAVPEPATWAMMMLGFGVVGGAMRRRRVRPEVAAR